MMSYSNHLFYFTHWYQQLLAESIGKTKEIGITPLTLRGSSDQHSILQLLQDGPNDKLTIFLEILKPKNDVKIIGIKDQKYNYLNGKTVHEILRREQEGTSASLSEDKRPNITVHITKLDEHHLGELIFLFEMQVALLGELFQINAFDQPGVEKSKAKTTELLKM